MQDLVFVAALLMLALIAVAFARGCDWVAGADEQALSAGGRDTSGQD